MQELLDEKEGKEKKKGNLIKETFIKKNHHRTINEIYHSRFL